MPDPEAELIGCPSCGTAFQTYSWPSRRLRCAVCGRVFALPSAAQLEIRV